VFALLPRDVCERYQVIAVNLTDTSLVLGVVNTQQLKQGFAAALKEVEKRIGKQIELVQLTAVQFSQMIAQYPKTAIVPPVAAAVPGVPNTSPLPSAQRINVVPPPQPVAPVEAAKPAEEAAPVAEAGTEARPKYPTPPWPPAPEPPLYDGGGLVAYNFLRRIPLDYSREHFMAVVDFKRPNQYWIVTDGQHDVEALAGIAGLAENNDVVIHILVRPPEELNRLLSTYARYEERTPTTEVEDDAITEAVPTPVAVSNAPDPITTSEDIVVPQTEGQILVREDERPGLAGFIQKVAQGFTAQEAEKQRGLPDIEPTRPNTLAPLPPVATATAPVPAAATAAPAVPPAIPATRVEVAAENGASQAQQTQDDSTVPALQVTTADQLKAALRAGNIPRMVAAVVSYAINERASDVHIEAYEDEMRIRYRVDGQLFDVVQLPRDIHSPLVSRIKILGRLRLDETRVPQDGRFDVSLPDGRRVDVRVAVMPTVYGEKVVLRLLEKSKQLASLDDLGLTGRGYDVLTKAIQRPYGICLSTGPTGSGKSTTLYAILSLIATPNVNVVTLEDPVEYEIKGINQAQVRPKIGFTFAEGLRSVLRQDPNIIMVGEIRDGETANMSIQAALTGHLVLSTMHTNDAAGAVPRLTNMGIEPFLITSALNVIVAQRLVRRICPVCKRPVSLPAGIRDRLVDEIRVAAALNPIDAARVPQGDITFYQGEGCDACQGKGYQGRVGIYEVLSMDDEVAELTVNRAPASDIRQVSQRRGMLTLYQDGLLKAASGLTTIDEVLREAVNR
jgi:type II secretory ATPase GspE/PulE/Tfp pilus assembly ATPase PilB-like protein